ncbi:alpha/beta hydrolase [Tabrizicola sp.]|uniref:alpha/beta hydrolase n=1 Tax=Tabrizicola sp. TaxID=2005166 RepID=UPI00286B1B1F|nr:alpha/beta hydrolase [Tabrizicola sp.]
MRHLLPCLIALMGATSPVAAQTTLADTLANLGGEPCENSDLTCVTLTVPRDHRANDPSLTMQITFAVSFATEDSKGMLFYFVGGPGGSGLASADNYIAAFDESLSQNMDIVFVDQRGTGPVHGLACPVAQARFDSADASIDQPEAAIATAKTYVNDCIAELDVGDFLAVVNSDQAIRDSELFRQAIGAPKVWLYGESYGTQFVQGYATLFPDAVRGVIVDGVVDLNLSAEGFYSAYTRASESLLARTLQACATLPGCAQDMGRDAAQVYDDLAAQLKSGPIDIDLVLADGSTVQRKLTMGLLDANAFYALYGPDGRSGFLRVLAAAGRGNLVPMLQLGYSNMYIDPQTESGLADPSWFGAAYYAITCTDYDSGTGTPEERAAKIIEEAKAFAPNAPRLLRSYYLERLACAFWPYQGEAKRPEPFAGGDYPTLVLNGDADPITPISMAYSVMDNAANSYGVFMKGGPHVIWGRGLACPDTIVQDLLYSGALPSAKEQQCEQDLMGDYTPLTLTDPAMMGDPLAVAQAVDTELLQSIELGNWDGEDPITVGCDLGGTVTASATETGTDYVLKDCSFWPGLAVSGTGTETAEDGENDGIILTLSVSGAHSGEVGYIYSTADEAWTLTGTYDGKPAGITRTYP